MNTITANYVDVTNEHDQSLMCIMSEHIETDACFSTVPLSDMDLC